MRGTPVLLQLYLLYYGLAGVLVAGAVRTAAILGLGLNYAAYEAEIYRGAIQAVPARQWEAALALGLHAARRRCGTWSCRRRCASRCRASTNDFISLLKDSSLVSVITVVELTKRMTITAVDNRGWLIPGAAVRGALLPARLPARAAGAPARASSLCSPAQLIAQRLRAKRSGCCGCTIP